MSHYGWFIKDFFLFVFFDRTTWSKHWTWQTSLLCVLWDVFFLFRDKTTHWPHFLMNSILSVSDWILSRLSRLLSMVVISVIVQFQLMMPVLVYIKRSKAIRLLYDILIVNGHGRTVSAELLNFPSSKDFHQVWKWNFTPVLLLWKDQTSLNIFS